MQILNNFQNAYTCIYEQNGKKQSLKAISYSKEYYCLMSGGRYIYCVYDSI